MSDGVYNIVCKQGETFSRLLTVTTDGGVPIDLTGYHVLMHVRKTHASNAIMLTVSDQGDTPLATIDGPLGKISIVVDPTTTQSLAAIPAVYDLKLISPSNYETRLLEGSFAVTASVTRAA